MPTEAERIAWAAGVFEGEGSITLHRSSSGRFGVRFTIAMTDRDVLERFRDAVGCGVLSERESWHSGSTKPQWRWQASREADIERLVRMFRPYLGERRTATLNSRLNEFFAQGPPGNHNRSKTHCKRGHPYSGDNLIWDHGRRRCRECERARGRKKQAAVRARLGTLTVEDVARKIAAIEANRA